MNFKEFLLTEESDSNRRLSVYKCPFCGGEAYDGIPGSGWTFRGSIQCSECAKSCAAHGQKRISEHGPLIGNPPKEFTDMCKETDRYVASQKDYY